MRVRFVFVLCAVMCLLLSGAVGAAAEPEKVAPSTETAKETAKPEQKTPEAKQAAENAEKKAASAAPVAAGDVCAIQATEQQAQIQALQAQIDALKQQIVNNQAGGTISGGASSMPAGVPDLAIRTRNLPEGDYRERCFACISAPDEEGQRVLMCTCPVGQTGMERLSVNLSSCPKNQKISYCDGMLVCGVCLLKKNFGEDIKGMSNVTGLEELNKKSTGKR